MSKQIYTPKEFCTKHRIQIQHITNPVEFWQAVRYQGHRKDSERSNEGPIDAVKKLAYRLNLDGKENVSW